jgi:hypothetical protein
VTPDGSIDYLYALTQFERFRALPKAEFDRAIDALTPQDVATSAEPLLERSVSTIGCSWCPAMGHCTLSGSGPAVDWRWLRRSRRPRFATRIIMSSVHLMKWVEQGVAPERIIATRVEDGKVVRQRPICAYPARQRTRDRVTSMMPPISRAARPTLRAAR